MRSLFIATLILLVSAWAVAQDTTQPSAPAGQGQTQSQPSNPSGQATPGAPSAMPMGGGEVVEGCLGGSNPNFTVTDKAGTVYQLQIPKGADASSLTPHVGESVAVQGTVDKASSKSGAASDMPADSSASKAAANSRNIQVIRIGRGTGTCPASSTAKPPSK